MNDQSVAKAEWKLGFKSKLDDLAHREAYGRLSEAETRHPAYEVRKTSAIAIHTSLAQMET